MWRQYKNHHHSRCQGHARATIDSAGQDVPVIPWYSERIVNLSIPALLVLKQEVGMVKCCEFYEPVVIVSKETPLGLESGKWWKACAAATSNHMYCSIQSALIVVFLFVGANILWKKWQSMVILQKAGIQ